MKLSYCPQMKIVHTSTKFHGQIYVPTLNWILLVGTVLVTAVYSNTTRLGHAYGYVDIIMANGTAFFSCPAQIPPTPHIKEAQEQLLT